MPKILTADDGPDVANVVHFRLAKQGYEILIAADGKQARAIFREIKPDWSYSVSECRLGTELMVQRSQGNRRFQPYPDHIHDRDVR